MFNGLASSTRSTNSDLRLIKYKKRTGKKTQKNEISNYKLRECLKKFEILPYYYKEQKYDYNKEHRN